MGKPKSRKTLRLTFQVINGEIELVNHRRVEMITPPAVGERPEAGKHGGAWVELRDKNGHVLFHRALLPPGGNTVEIHSPDGTIRREYAPSRESTFEVLVPDYGDAASIVFYGKKSGSAHTQPTALTAAAPPKTREVARFEIPGGGEEQ